MERIEVTDAALRQAAAEGMDAFIQVFTDAYRKAIGDELTAETMPLLTGEQHTLLAYQIFRDELMDGGFCQLIQNGYGGYIFVDTRMAVDLFPLTGKWQLYMLPRKFMMPIAKTWNVSVRTMNLWPCMKIMRLSTIWKMSLWSGKRNLPLK